MAFPPDITVHAPLLLIGAGNMGGALLKGWLEAGIDQRTLIVVDHGGRERLKAIAGAPRFSVYRELGEVPDIPPPAAAVFAVKPQAMAGVLKDARRLPLEDSLLVSIAAGTPITAFETAFGKKMRVVRAMPNTPAAVGKGVSVLAGNRNAGEEDLVLAERLMAAGGKVFRAAEEGMIDAVTAVSGSGPAYFYALAEALAKAAKAAGLPDDLAGKLARETFIGAAALLEASGESPRSLRKKVTSPKGTTEAALEVLLAKGGLDDLVKEAVLKARERAKALSK